MITVFTEAKNGWGVLGTTFSCPFREVVPLADDRQTMALEHTRGLRCQCQPRYSEHPNAENPEEQVILVHRMLMGDFA